MYYYKARIYSPTLGRFLQTDPIGYEDQINLYGYVGNDPINLIDPTGMMTDETGEPKRESKYELDISATLVAVVGLELEVSVSIDTDNLEIATESEM